MGIKAAVVGSGIGGLASALRLAAKGYQVEVFEKAAVAGGKINEIRMNGFRFDTGPSLLTFPSLIHELFALFQEDPKDFIQFMKLEISCKYFWEDRTMVEAWQDPSLFAHEIKQTTGVDARKVISYLQECEKLYQIAGDAFIFNSLHKPSNYFTASFLKTLLQVPALDPLRTLHQRNKAWFGHPKVVQIFDRYATYNGSSPYHTPATLRMIAHLEHNGGAFFPFQGMYSIVQALVNFAKSKGVKFHFHSEVEKILTSAAGVKGVRVNGTELPFDVVVSDIDVVSLYNNLLDGYPLPAIQASQQRSSSALIFYWGIGKSFPNLNLHNVLFSSDYRKEFRHLFETHTIADDPTVYIFISSKMIPGDAPEGAENWYVMINAPENNGQYTTETIQYARSRIIEKIQRTLGIDISPLILCETFADPKSIEADTGSYKGSLYGLSSNGIWAAFNRHPNFSHKVNNLYFVGGSVHPGGGIPLCLASVKIVANELPLIS